MATALRLRLRIVRAVRLRRDPARQNAQRVVGRGAGFGGQDHQPLPGLVGAKFLEWTSIDRIATFDAFTAVPLLGARPLLMIVGTRAVTSWMSLEAYHRATGPKRIHWIEGASHADLYDRDQYVGPAVDELEVFFETNLQRD